MRSVMSALTPLFRSQHMAEMLAHVLMHPEQEFGLSELARELDMPLTTVQTEAKRLITAGIFRSRKVGNTRLVAADQSNPMIRPMAEMLSFAYGPRAVIGQEFSQVAGAERVIIFGSWAARFAGVNGPPPNDIDVLVVGDGMSQLDIFDAADRAQRTLGTPVNPVLCTPRQWAEPAGDVLLTQIQRAPFLQVFSGVDREAAQ